MKVAHSLAVPALLVLSLLQVPVQAHEVDEADKAKPTTCEQLADTGHYSTDMSDPEIKALKERCDTAKAAADAQAASAAAEKDD